MTSPNTRAITVGIFYPTEWLGDETAVATEIEAIRSIDDRIRVVTVPYIESSELRSARGSAPRASWQDECPPLTDEQAEALARCEIAVALDLPVDVADRAPELRWVQAVGAGTDQFAPCEFADTEVVLTNNGGANAVGIAEFAIGRLIEVNKNFVTIRRDQDAQNWTPRFGRQMAGQTLGLIGFGAINSAVAERARAFGMNIHASRRSPAEHPLVDRMFSSDDLLPMLSTVDAVIAAVPDNASTRGLVDAAAFAAMRPDSFFCNVGRGSLVEESALVEALRSGHLGAAALDVASLEPLPPEHELWTAPNLSLSAHCSSVPSAMFGNVQENFRANLARYLRNEPLEHRVDA